MKKLFTIFGLVIFLTANYAGSALADDPEDTEETGDDQAQGPAAKAFLNGYQEVPAISTQGKGLFRIKLKDPSTLEYTLSFSDLEGTATQAHIHFGQLGVPGGIIANLCGDGVKPACTPGQDIVGTIMAANILDLSVQGIEAGGFEEALRAIRSGNTYVNVRSDVWPNGEIRGQISPHRFGNAAGVVHSRQKIHSKSAH
jgi:CHRD domain